MRGHLLDFSAWFVGKTRSTTVIDLVLCWVSIHTKKSRLTCGWPFTVQN